MHGPLSASSPLLANLLLLPRMLRQAGLPVSLDQTLSFARALEWVDVSNRDQVFHASRSLLVTRQEALRLFETIFSYFWRLTGDRGTPRLPPSAAASRRTERRPFDIATYLAHKARRTDPEVEVRDRSGTWSREEVLRHKAFSEMSGRELAVVRRLIAEMRWQASWRRTRRRLAAARGETIDLRRALRQVARTGCVPPRPAWRRRKIKPRPIVLIADVSGSMEKVSRLILQLFYALSHSLRGVECFTFGTRLTRITQEIRLRNIDRAIDEASRQVVDWAGGTRIGESLYAFNRRWSRRVLRRGAVVLIASDGWERGDVSLLAREARYLSRRCHRLIWLNPLAGTATYRPRVGGMAAVLPYLDDFLPVRDLASLEQLAARLQSLPARRSATASTARDAGPACERGERV